MKKKVITILILTISITLSGCQNKVSDSLDKENQEQEAINLQQIEFNLELEGLDLETAKNLIEESEFKLGNIEEKVSFEYEPGIVLESTPKKGDITTKGESIKLIVNKESITIEEGLELVKRSVETASINQESKIGDKTYYFYSNNRPGDSVTCLDPVTREILHYYSDGSLVNSKGEVISREKADWQK